MAGKSIHKRIELMWLKTKALLRDKDRKPLPQILRELVKTAFMHRCIPLHYFTSFLYRKEIKNYLDYICARESLQIHRACHRQDTLDILDNKLLFHKHFSKKSITLPLSLGYNLKTFWFADEAIDIRDTEVRTVDEFTTLMLDLFQHSDCSVIFAKPLRGGGGSGIIRLTREIFEPISKTDCNRVFQLITGGCFIFQKQVIQHPELSRLYDLSLNTIRIDTFLDDNNNPEIISAYLRMGISGRVVDNLGAGGIYVGIDLTSGKLQKIARNKMEQGGIVYIKHPDSGIAFEGFAIPYFEDVKALARQAARQISENLVGWDIGITVDGPVLIEGNGWYELTYVEIAYGGYRRNPVFKKAMRAAGLRIRD